MRKSKNSIVSEILQTSYEAIDAQVCTRINFTCKWMQNNFVLNNENRFDAWILFVKFIHEYLVSQDIYKTII